MEIVLTYVLSKLGGKATLDDIYSVTKVPKTILKKYLWYCQRRKLIRRDVGVYHITDAGWELIRGNRIISIKDKIFIVSTSDEIQLVTLGKKTRRRVIKKDLLIRLIHRGCITRDEIRNSYDRKTLAAAIRILRILRVAKTRGEKICIVPQSLGRLRILGINIGKTSSGD